MVDKSRPSYQIYHTPNIPLHPINNIAKRKLSIAFLGSFSGVSLYRHDISYEVYVFLLFSLSAISGNRI